MANFKRKVWESRLVENFNEMSVLPVLTTAPSEMTGESVTFNRANAGTIADYTGSINWEAVETTPLILVKKNGERELFDREKLLKSMLKACEKRPISAAQLSAVCDRVERNLLNRLEKEISTEIVGELVMDELKQIDKVAYIRFASVYRDFRDIETFLKAINEIQAE